MTQTDLHYYFSGERTESVIFVLIGGVATSLGIYFIYDKSEIIWYGAAIPALLVGLIQLIVGFTVYFRSGKREDQISMLCASEPLLFAQEELERMKKVNRNFDVYKIWEIVLAFLGLASVALTFSKPPGFWLGLGISLFLQSGIMFIMDVKAERRADAYTAQLEETLRKNEKKPL